MYISTLPPQQKTNAPPPLPDTHRFIHVMHKSLAVFDWGHVRDGLLVGSQRNAKGPIYYGIHTLTHTYQHE